MMNAKEHNNLLGIFLLVYEILQIIGLVIGILVMIGMMGFVFSQVPGREALPFGLVMVIVLAVLMFSALLLIPGFIAAVKIRRESPDARGWAIAASIIALINFPLGTALGVYGLWFLMGDMGKNFYLRGGSKGYFTTPPAPPAPSSWK